jgi:hypothetical protein
VVGDDDQYVIEGCHPYEKASKKDIRSEIERTPDLVLDEPHHFLISIVLTLQVDHPQVKMGILEDGGDGFPVLH